MAVVLGSWRGGVWGGVSGTKSRILKRTTLRAVSVTVIGGPLPELSTGFVVAVMNRLVFVVLRLQNFLR